MPTNLKKLLADRLPAEELTQLVGSFDVVGDTALVRLPDALLHRSELVVEAIFSTNRRLKTVLRRVGGHSGEYRQQPLEVIGGEPRKETEVVEFGLRYRLNLESCYFSVRSGAERRRVAEQTRAQERVLVLFSGIAPFPLMIAKLAGVRVVGVEKNPEAHRFACDNVRRNHLSRLVQLHCADAAEFMAGCTEHFDRIVMPLPKGGAPFLPAAFGLLQKGGTLHCYRMAKKDEVAVLSERVRGIAEEVGHRVVKIVPIKAGHCGNRVFRWCFEVQT